MSSSELHEYTLGSLIKIKHGYAFKGEHFSEAGHHIVLTPGNFHEEGGFKLRPEKDRYYTGQFPDDYILKQGDLIVAMTEQAEGLLGSPAIIPEPNKFLHNQRLGLIEVTDKEALNKRYLFHVLNTSSVRQQIRGSSSGAKIRHTSPERMYRTKVLLPNLETQEKIAAIVSAYDDLIENNTRRIALLEKMAEEVYREWFVRLRFPGHERVPVHQGVPEGWGMRRVADLGNVVTGKTPSTNNSKFYGGNYHFVKTPDMHGNIFIHQTQETLTDIGIASQPSQTIPRHSICVSCIGTAGVVSITTTECQTNQQINSLVLAEKDNLEWAFFTLRNLESIINLFGTTGATMTNVSKGKFSSLPVMFPPTKTRSLYHSVTCPMFHQLDKLSVENLNLKKTRDILLSRLLSGKLDVEELDIEFPPGMRVEAADYGQAGIGDKNE